MGSVFKAVKKVAKRITRPVSKITKGIARGIAKVGKSVMKGVAKINKKLGPLGMIAMSIAMPYALGGLSNIIGHGGMAAGQSSGLLGSQNLFLRSIGQVGNAIRTGYQATTGAISNTLSTITKSISKGFQNFAGKFKGQNNIFSRISEGAKNLFKQSKTTVNNWKSKFKFGKTPTDGSVDVFGMRGNVHGEGQIWSSVSNEQAAGMIKSAAKQGLEAPILRGQSIGKTLSGVDKIVADNINSAWENKNLMNMSDNAKLAYNNYKDAAMINNDGFYQAEQIGNIMNKNMDMSGTSDALMDFNFSKSKDFSYSPQHDKYIFNGNDSFKVNNKSTLKNKTTEWLKKKVKSKAFNSAKDYLLKQSIPIEAPDINYAMMGAMHTGSTQGQDAKWSGTDLKGASQGSLLHGTFSANQIDQINNYYRHMNI